MISDQFKQAVGDKDEGLVKIMLKNSLMTDLSFADFHEMLGYAKKFIPEIIDKHDGAVFLEKEKWTESYGSELKADLVGNFSEERIEHVKDVQKYLYDKNHEIKININLDSVDKQIDSNNSSSKNATYFGGVKNEGIKPDKHSLKALITTLGVAGASIAFGVLFDMSVTAIALGTIMASAIVGGMTYYLVKK